MADPGSVAANSQVTKLQKAYLGAETYVAIYQHAVADCKVVCPAGHTDKSTVARANKGCKEDSPAKPCQKDGSTKVDGSDCAAVADMPVACATPCEIKANATVALRVSSELRRNSDTLGLMMMFNIKTSQDSQLPASRCAGQMMLCGGETTASCSLQACLLSGAALAVHTTSIAQLWTCCAAMSSAAHAGRTASHAPKRQRPLTLID